MQFEGSLRPGGSVSAHLWTQEKLARDGTGGRESKVLQEVLADLKTVFSSSYQGLPRYLVAQPANSQLGVWKKCVPFESAKMVVSLRLHCSLYQNVHIFYNNYLSILLSNYNPFIRITSRTLLRWHLKLLQELCSSGLLCGSKDILRTKNIPKTISRNDKV